MLAEDTKLERAVAAKSAFGSTSTGRGPRASRKQPLDQRNCSIPVGLQSSFAMKVDIDGPARSVFMRSEQYKFITGKNVRVCHTPIKSTWRLLGFEFKRIHMTDINTTTPIDLPIFHPAAHCDCPDDVLNDLALSVAEKRIILSSWASDMYHHDQGRSAPVCPGGSRLCSLGEPDGISTHAIPSTMQP